MTLYSRAAKKGAVQRRTEREKSMKKFLWKICPFVLFVLLLEIGIPVAVDPYNVFHWAQIRDNGVEPNSNYIKMQYILHNPDKFDSFLFGSSRTGFINVDQIPEGNWYNMSYSEGLPAEHLDNLEEMIENGIIPKNVMIGLDNISCFVDPALHQEQFYRIPYPREDKLEFYANYFSIKGVLQSLRVILNYEPTDPDYVERYYENGGTVRDPSLGGTWEGDSPYWEDYYTDYLVDSFYSIEAIMKLCEEYDINLIVFTNPIYYRTYQQSKFYGYENYLIWLAEWGLDYYNFSGENAITTDRTYYYESSHYTEVLGDMIVDRIFYGKTDESLESQGFGMYVTEENLDEFQKALANH